MPIRNKSSTRIHSLKFGGMTSGGRIGEAVEMIGPPLRAGLLTVRAHPPLSNNAECGGAMQNLVPIHREIKTALVARATDIHKE